MPILTSLGTTAHAGQMQPRGPSAVRHQKPSNRHDYVIDVISIGSETRPELLQAQMDTWAGAHRFVRHFWGFTERQDVDRGCADVAAADLATLVRTCRAGSGFDPLVAGHVRRYYGFSEGLRNRAEEPGWLCAQRRVGPLLGWLQAQYAAAGGGGEGEDDLPSLLVFVDDDTFLDLKKVKRFIAHHAMYAKTAPLAGSACVVKEDRGSEIAFSFPYGGFGSFFDKAALRDMVRPIKCTTGDSSSAFDKRICATLKEDRVGELGLFKEGMTILELFHKYTSLPVYCMHSDWILGYMVK